MATRPGILLVNLGSPASTSVADVRKYLNEFLMDKNVIDIPWPLRRLLVSAFVLPTRPKQSAEAYKQIWLPEGSPLIHISRQLKDQVQIRTELPVELGMRYGEPSTRRALQALQKRGIDQLRVIPLYPHYAMSSFGTAIEKIEEELKNLNWSVPLKVRRPFYADPDYIQALVASAQEDLNTDYDHILFSYHGIPLRQVLKTDPTGKHCMQDPEGFPSCCHQPSEAHHRCYRHQVYATTQAFVKAAGIPEDKYSISFQSRLGRTPWLRPYTDFVLPDLAKAGHKRVLIISPSFVSDCLETLEELGVRGVELFTEAGGQTLQPIPCMNIHPQWVKTVVKWAESDSDYETVNA